ncbi:MAG: SAVED domain-containing protein, partial [Lachnospiraceae bacterium]|nr:SAVED domain-containing protein [Lachnospiraceae bacterium]
LQADQFDSALILNVTRNINSDVIRFIRENNLPIGRIINCIPNEAGATNISIKNGTHAAILANNVYNAIAMRSTVERRATLHIFASAPNAFMFFLGQNSVGFGKCILYEYDYDQMNSCTYSQSISFIN